MYQVFGHPEQSFISGDSINGGCGSRDLRPQKLLQPFYQLDWLFIILSACVCVCGIKCTVIHLTGLTSVFSIICLMSGETIYMMMMMRMAITMAMK